MLLAICSCSVGNCYTSNNKLIRPANFVTTSTYYYDLPFAGKGMQVLDIPVYIINNHNQTISNITFSESSVVPYIKSASLDTHNCKNIASGQICKFNLSITLESSGIYNGSVLVNADFTIDSHPYHITTLVSFAAVVAAAQNKPIYDSSIFAVSSNSNNVYVEVFFLVPGNPTNTYIIKYLNNGYTILNSNISDGGIVSGGNVVSLLLRKDSNPQAQDISSHGLIKSALSPIATLTDIDGNVNIISNDIITEFDVVGAGKSAPYIVSGTPSIITTQNQKYIVINYLNIGVGTANFVKLNYNQSVLTAEQNNCNETLEPLQACSVVFRTLTSHGSDNIVISYSGNLQPISTSSVVNYSEISSVSWYLNKATSPLLLTTLSRQIGLSQYKLTAIPITISNVGIDLNKIHYSVDYGGQNGSANLSGADNCRNLVSGASCQFDVLLFSTTVEPSNLAINASGTFGGANESYNIRLSSNLITYSGTVGNANLTPESAIYSMSIIDNNYNSSTSTIKYTNTGSVATYIESIALAYNGTSTQPNWIYVNSDRCSGQSLKPNASCQVVVKLGPVIFPQNNMSVQDAITLNAVYTYQNAQGTMTVATAPTLIQYQIGKTIYSVYIDSVTANNALGGIGLLSAPYDFSGLQALLAQQVIITYKNNGSDPALILGLQQNNLNPVFWTAQDNCTGNVLTPIAQGNANSCTVVYNNNFYNWESMPAVTSRDFSFDLPTNIIRDTLNGVESVVLPTYHGQTNLSVFESMAMITNQVSLNAQGNLVISQTIESSIGYPMIDLTSYSSGVPLIQEYIATVITPENANVSCSSDIKGFALLQNCHFTPDVNYTGPVTITNTYALWSKPTSGNCIQLNFSESTPDVVLGMNKVMDNSICF